MGEGLHKGAESEDPGVQRHHVVLVPRVVVAALALLPCLLLLPEPPAGLSPGQLYPHLAPEPGQELRHCLVTDKARVQETTEYLGCLLPHCDVGVRQELRSEGDHLGPQLVVGHEASLQHVEAGGQGMGREDADGEAGEGLETRLRHSLVRLSANKLTHVGK